MSSIEHGPFPEENDVSGRVVKSIYVENQVNDGQTQRTEQAMVLFAAVRAEHTVSESTEESSTSLNPISSSNIKEALQEPIHKTLYDPDSCYNQWLAPLNLPLLPHPQTLYSFLKHIHQYNFTQYNNFNYALRVAIKLDYSECYIHPPHVSEPLPDYFFPYLSGYNYYPSIPIPSKFSPTNDNILDTSLIIKDNELNNTYSQLFGDYDETFIYNQYYNNIQFNTCYNKFLFYNHIPLLPHPQTIITFL
jgi:hypothetical protein